MNQESPAFKHGECQSSLAAMNRFESICALFLMGGFICGSIGVMGFLRCLVTSNRPVPLAWLALSDILFFGYSLAMVGGGFVGFLLLCEPIIFFQTREGIILLLALSILGGLIGLLRAHQRIKTWK